MRAIILAIGLVLPVSAGTAAVDDAMAFRLLHEQVGVHVYNAACGGDDFFVPTAADKVVSDRQRLAFGRSGALKQSMEHWLSQIMARGCQPLARKWSIEGVM